MLTANELIAIISLCIACYGLGYLHGQNTKTQK